MNKVGIGLLAGVLTLGGVYAASAFANDDVDTKSNTIEQKKETKQNQQVTEKADFILIEEAIKVAQSKEKGYLTDVELEWEHGSYIYQVDLQGEGTETEVKLDALTKEIIKVEIEKDDDRDEEMKLTQTLFSVNEAIQLAEKETGGTFSELQLDKDFGKLVYKVELEGQHEAEVKLDAITGEILEIDRED